MSTLSIHTIVYSNEDEFPSLVALYTRREDATLKLNEILKEFHGEEFRRMTTCDDILYTDSKGLITLRYSREYVDEILSSYYTVIHWTEDSHSKVITLHKRLESAIYLVENLMNHNCVLDESRGDTLVWNNKGEEGLHTIISIRKYDVE